MKNGFTLSTSLNGTNKKRPRGLGTTGAANHEHDSLPKLGPINPPRNKADVMVAVVAGEVALLDEPVWVVDRFLATAWAEEDVNW